MKKNSNKADNWDQIRGHLLLASRELLLAGKGVIQSLQKEGLVKNSPQMDKIFKQASMLADDFAKGIINTNSFTEIAKDMLLPIIKSTPPKNKPVPKNPKRSKK